MISAKSLVRTAATCLLLAGGTFGAPSSWATVISATVTPTTKPIPLTQPSSVTLTWTVVRDNGACGPTVATEGGDIKAGDPSSGPDLYFTPPVSQTKPCVGPTTTFTFTEILNIPAGLALRAQRLGFSNLAYRRIFDDGLGGVGATVILPITSGSASGLSLTRIALLFDNGAPIRVLGLREKLYARAEIDFTGTGLLQGVWEVAGPTSTAGEPVYRPLRSVRQYLVGGDKQILRSPDLPTDSSGFYLVRLRVTDPVPGFDQPILRYFVSSGRPGEVLPVQPIGLVTPARQALLAPDTVFAWKPVHGARAYQVELYAPASTAADKLPSLGGDESSAPPRLPDAPPVTGMLVAGAQTQTPLSGAARSHLKPGRVYLWRVRAIGEGGNILGVSPVREIRLP